MVTFAPVETVDAALKTTAKLVGEVFVRAVGPAGCFTVTLGFVVSHVTVLSVDVDTVLVLPAGSEATPAPIEAVTVPSVVIPATAMLKVLLSELGFVTVTVFVPPAVPPTATSEAVNVALLIVSLKTTVKSIGEGLLGSVCMAACVT